jgi:hypothetical protein
MRLENPNLPIKDGSFEQHLDFSCDTNDPRLILQTDLLGCLFSTQQKQYKNRNVGDRNDMDFPKA